MSTQAPDSVFSQLVEILATTLAIDPSLLQLDTDLVTDIGIESIELVTIVAAVEDQMGVTLDIRRLRTMRTLREVFALLES